MLDRSHAISAGKLHRVTTLHGVYIGISAGVTTRLTAEVILHDLFTLGGHVATGVLTDVGPSLALLNAIDDKLVECVVGTGGRSEGKEVGE